jgi:hypothetical protein
VTYEWTIWKEGELYRMRRNDGVEPAPARLSQLPIALPCHGIMGDLYNDVCRQLNESGKATVDVMLSNIVIRQL